jgi:hypothetical protein
MKRFWNRKRPAQDSTLGRVLEMASIPLFTFGLIIMDPLLLWSIQRNYWQPVEFFAISIPMFFVGHWLRRRAFRPAE